MRTIIELSDNTVLTVVSLRGRLGERVVESSKQEYLAPLGEAVVFIEHETSFRIEFAWYETDEVGGIIDTREISSKGKFIRGKVLNRKPA